MAEVIYITIPVTTLREVVIRAFRDLAERLGSCPDVSDTSLTFLRMVLEAEADDMENAPLAPGSLAEQA